MTLNIKDGQARELAQALAKETGETMTAAVIEALRERLARVQQQRRVASADELLAIGRGCAVGISGRAVAHDEFLYDQRGLPG